MTRAEMPDLKWIPPVLIGAAALAGCARSEVADRPTRGPEALAAEQYLGDFDALWSYVRDHYAYFDQKEIDWEQVLELYRPRAAQVKGSRQFVGLLEDVLSELYDPHAHLGINTAASPRQIPTGSDLWGEWRGERAMITDVRAESSAEEVGVRSGMEVLTVDGLPIHEAVRQRLPATLLSRDPAAYDWALRAVLAGHHDAAVQLEVQEGGRKHRFDFRPGSVSRPEAPLTAEVLDDSIGHVRINNTLGNTGLIAAFDSALGELRGTRGLVLDLRDTPSGGNTTVARGIMGRLIADEMPYQRHELPAEERAFGVQRLWTEYVAPRGPFTYGAPVVVLVGRWTGSMGEGLAMGLDGMGRAVVIGRPMAGLLGALHETTLPHTGFIVRVPAERLFHIDGTPREAFAPRVLVEPGSPGQDAAVEAALHAIRRQIGY